MTSRARRRGRPSCSWNPRCPRAWTHLNRQYPPQGSGPARWSRHSSGSGGNLSRSAVRRS
eukprot:14920189-Alexandrium_andersonii.AAC.1